MRIRYCGPALDYSGYGEANRHDIAALVSAGCDVSVELMRHCLEISEFGPLGKMVQELQSKINDYTFKILHTTPNLFGQFIEPGKYHIGRVFWETDILPPEFARGAQMCDEIWTGSEFNLNAIRKAGVTKPIYIIPEAVDTDIDVGTILPFQTSQEGTYNFYSIFEWTERKDPRALLTAYFNAFGPKDKVTLTLKTYVDNFTPEKKRLIEEHIQKIKNELNLSYYPPVFFCIELLSREQMYRFHKSFDCFVSAHRGEGWGIPQMEALLMGNPMISTNLGGIHESLTDNFDAYLVENTLVPIGTNMRNAQWYREDQHWGQVDIFDLISRMRYVYKNQAHAKTVGRRGRETVLSKFDVKVVGQLMLKRLKEISVDKQENTGIE